MISAALYIINKVPICRDSFLGNAASACRPSEVHFMKRLYPSAQDNVVEIEEILSREAIAPTS